MNTQGYTDINLIDPNPYQHKEFVDAAKVQEIAESLKQNLAAGIGRNGLLQVPTARKVDGRYQLAFGHHRHLAFIYLFKTEGLEQFARMPLIIEDLTDQQMFEAMAAENLDRRDISFIEEAETYHQYMVTFDKNSVETAARFGKTDEHVRGRIMFLQLPDAAKEQAKTGKVNVSVARDLVTVNKLLGAEGVGEALEHLENVGEHDVYDTPREAISELLEESKNLVKLDAQSGWFSVKNFPTQYLDKLTINTVDKVLGIDAKEYTPELRAEVKKLIGYLVSAMNFADEMFPLIHAWNGKHLEQLRILVSPPACDGCAMHAIFDGDHYCPSVQCKTRKETGWERKVLEDAASKVGIPLYKKEDGQTVEMNWRDAGDQKLVKSKHADLRLMKAQYMWNNFDGVGQHLKVVAVGKTAEKRLGVKEDADQKVDREKVKREREQQRHHTKAQFLFRFQWEVVSDIFASALDGVTNISLLDFMVDEMVLEAYGLNANYPEDTDDVRELLGQARKMKKADGIHLMRRIFMHECLDNKCGETTRELLDKKQPIVEYVKSLTDIAAEWGVKLGKIMTHAEKYQADLDAALKELNKPVVKEKA